MDWYGLVKRYVWDKNKTPYFTKVPDLHKKQAQSEMFAYSVFLAILFAVIALAALAGRNSPAAPANYGLAFYSFSIFCASIIWGYTKNYYLSIYCGTAPIAALLIILNNSLNVEVSDGDKILLTAISVLWIFYARRIAAISRAYPQMPEPSGD